MIDLRMYMNRFRDLHHEGFFTDPGLPFVYFAPGVFLYPGFFAFGVRGSVYAYTAVTFAALLFGFLWLRRCLVRVHLSPRSSTAFLLIALVTSYPILFTAERGNLEMMIAIGLAVGTWAFWKGHPWYAAILWGIFGSVKLYPLLLSAIFLSRRQYRQLLLTVATAASMILLSTLYIGPTFSTALEGLRMGTRTFLQLVTLQFYSEGFDHSFFMLLKLGTLPFHVNRQHLLLGYMTCISLIMLLLFFVRIRKLPRANQLLILSVCSVTLPPTSFDYTLIQLYAPWAVLVLIAVRASAAGTQIPGLRVAFALLALIFTPTNIVFVHGAAYSAQLKSLLLLTLLILALVNPFQPVSEAGEPRPARKPLSSPASDSAPI